MNLPIPPSPEVLRDKLDTVTAQGLLHPDALEPPPSPCVCVCRMDEARAYCLGCLRTLDELRAWGKADAATKRAIWEQVRIRSGQQAAAGDGCSAASCAGPQTTPAAPPAVA